MFSSNTTTSSTGTNGVTCVDESLLIQLRTAAHLLPLHNSSIHASQGGAYLSAFKGRGMEFDESRLYQGGDDIRNMDWRVTARTGKPHTKVFREERERPVLILTDLSRSMHFATRNAYKSVIAARAAALLAWSAISHSDRLGGVICSENALAELRPRRGKSAVLHYIKQLVTHQAWNNTRDLSQTSDTLVQSLSRMRRVVRPGSLVFLISDFRNLFDDSHKSAISHLTQISRNNDVVLIFTHDPLETSLPATLINGGRYRVSDGARDQELHLASRSTRHEYKQKFIQHQQQLQTLCHQNRMYLFDSSTDEDTLASLQRGLGLRTLKLTSQSYR